MSREIIEKTAFCYWSDDDDCYVVESSKLPSVAAIGDTEKEAWDCFSELLDETMPKIEAGRVAGYTTPGRPAKNGAHIHAQVKSTTKAIIESLATEFGISQTDAIDHLAFHFERVRSQDKMAKILEDIRQMRIDLDAGQKKLDEITVTYSSVNKVLENTHLKTWLEASRKQAESSSIVSSNVTQDVANNIVRFPSMSPKAAHAS